jgi:hypothetical protein
MVETALTIPTTVIDANYRGSDRVRRQEIAQTQDTEKLKAVVDLAKSALDSPFVWCVGGTLAIEKAQREQWCGEVAGGFAEASLYISAILRAITQPLGSGDGSLLGDIAKLIPFFVK